MSLSERIRANSEASPWVIEEVMKMEADRDEWKEAAVTIDKENNRLNEQIKEMKAERDRLRVVIELLLDVWAPNLDGDDPNCGCQGCDAVGKARAALAGEEK